MMQLLELSEAYNPEVSSYKVCSCTGSLPGLQKQWI